ncbi:MULTISPECIES: cell division protein FtsQ/DivIB [Glaesserella]|uniref:Cell division protein FtsQ n=1 Tax=Glaesserella australis TaxID=2094024 RepID=A0A328C438_9PAST|nr:MULTISPECIES: cell division protein FtsQ/DivIB [Glaesserella]AUI66272.1 cell division protein FtsQ [Glaesserella sp. 15-184]RAL19294.1 cell division protein FtsQ [Glaesserella australis]
MVAVFRKKPTSVIRTKVSKPKPPINWLSFFKPALVLICLVFVYIVYANWVNWLQALDKTPIRSYALTHKTQFTTNNDIREVLSKEPVLKGYFGQNIQEVKEKFLALSWVKDVVVRKVYPDKLSLTLLEYRPVALWNNSQYLSEQGVVFSLPSERFDHSGLPILYGPDSEGKVVLEAWNKIKTDLKARNLGLYSVAMDNRGSWSIRLDNGVELRLGRGDWLPKIDRFVTIFPEIEIPEGKRLSYVDLRYEHGASVGFSNQ